MAKKIGGDITLRQSQKGLTVISFKVPVTVEEGPDKAVIKIKCL
jgi:hypothetical protein